MEQELHPFEQSSLANEFSITAAWHIKNDILHLHSTCLGPVERLDFDKSAKPQAADELWKKTCFECFLLQTNSTQYTEWNFSPGGNFQRYQFLGYRERVMNAPSPLPGETTVNWKFSTGSLDVRTEIPLASEIQKLQVAWVLKTKAGETMHWSLNHTSGKPDFHNASDFENLIA